MQQRDCARGLALLDTAEYFIENEYFIVSLTIISKTIMITNQ